MAEAIGRKRFGDRQRSYVFPLPCTHAGNPMTQPRDPSSSFRHTATVVYRIVCVVLVALVAVAGWIGWHFGAWIGLAIGTGVGAVVAVVVWCGATLFWAMAQDGA